MSLAPIPAQQPLPAPSVGITKDERRVIIASSLGTVFEWYDFYLYGSLAAIIARQFFSSLNETSQFIFALLAFSAGFAVRPFGAIFFGRLGDLVGRKYAFLMTILIMGLSTTLVGFLPSYATIGAAAPVLLIGLRLIQGLALGGEYAGAATYVAEHAPPGKRGLFTSWIQTTATVGLFLSLLVILGTRVVLGPRFDDWGWRIPFVLSLLLLAVSVYIRLQLQESPVFMRMKAEGKASKAPLTESFLRWGNLRVVLLVLFGGVAGQAVVWFTGMFYALFFLTETLKVPAQPANIMVAVALMIATPFFVVFGALSDRIGRKRIILFGCVLAATTYRPIFMQLTAFANPAISEAAEKSPVTVIANPDDCSFQFDPIGRRRFTTSCDIAKAWLARKAIPYRNAAPTDPGATLAVVMVGNENAVTIPSFDGRVIAAADLKTQLAAFDEAMTATIVATKAAKEGEAPTLTAAGKPGYPAAADMKRLNAYGVVALLSVLALYVTVVYAPIAAWLVELFPARIRYTSMSLPYQIGEGWFGGFLPAIAFAMVAATGDIYYGLWYPIVVSVVTAIIGTLFLPETKDREIYHDA